MSLRVITSVKLKGSPTVLKFLQDCYGDASYNSLERIDKKKPYDVHVWFSGQWVVNQPFRRKDSPKHQPLVSLGQLKDLMILPSDEARLEYCKATLKRKF